MVERRGRPLCVGDVSMEMALRGDIETEVRSKKLLILGSTGSLGRQALEIVSALAGRIQVVGLAAGSNLDLLAVQMMAHRPQYYWSAERAGGGNGPAEQAAAAIGALRMPMDEMGSLPEVDLVLLTTSGKTGLAPALAAIEAGKPIALANKEVLVMAGDLVMKEAARRGVQIIPVDSEHSAVWQCLRGEQGASRCSTVRRVVLTASGGAFRDRHLPDLAAVTPAEALAHPTWTMGPKVTIDSATLMNKGFEVIEAHHLFGLPYDALGVVLHRESVVHSLVEFVDGSVKAQMGVPDMRLPIQYALCYPDRYPAPWPKLSFDRGLSLNFAPLEAGRYPCYALALGAARRGGTYPSVLAASDEVAVELFLAGKIGYLDIPALVSGALEAHQGTMNPTLDEILEADAWSRRVTMDLAAGTSTSHPHDIGA